MQSIYRTLLGVVATATAIAVMPAFAQKPFTEQAPTKEDPLRFSAFAVNMQGSMAGTVQIAIERWSTEAERDGLIGLVQTATDRPHGQDQLLKALEGVKPRTGFIRTPNSLGWDLKYAHEDVLSDGSRRIVIATDKPVSFLAAASSARTLDYPFSLVEMRFPASSNKGEGKLLSQTSISTKNGKLQLEIYGQEPTRLTTITEEKGKGEK
jgi:hypothetical protein